MTHLINQGAIAAALRARSLALRRELAARVLRCFSFLLLSLSLRLPMKNSFQYFYQICRAVTGFMANISFQYYYSLSIINSYKL